MNRHQRAIFPVWMKIIFGCIILFLLAGGAWFFLAQQHAQQHAIEGRLLDIAQIKADQIADWRKDQIDDATFIAQIPSIREEIYQLDVHPDSRVDEEIVTLLRSLQAQHGYYEIFILDGRGNLRLNLGGSDMDVPDECRETLSHVIENEQSQFIDFHIHTYRDDTNMSVASVMVPVLFGPDDHKEYVGTLVVVNAAQDYLFPMIEIWPTQTKTAETLLVRKEGDSALFLNELRHQKNTTLKLKIPLSRADLPAAMAIQGVKGIVKGKDYRGVDVLAAILPIDESPWFIVAKLDSSEAFADWRFNSILIIFLIAGALALVVVGAKVVEEYNLRNHYHQLFESEAALRASMEKHAVTLQAIGDAVISTDRQGRVELMNPIAEQLTGWSQEEACGKDLTDVFPIINEETRNFVENPVVHVLREGVVVGLANHTLLINKDGHEIPIADSGAPIKNDSGEIIGVVMVFRDQSEERLAQQMAEIRLKLLEYTADHSLHELLIFSLDEVSALLKSSVGFCHFVSEDQKTLILQEWSTQTLKDSDMTNTNEHRYEIEKAGVWVDCFYDKKPVIHNDYAALPHKKGLPDGHVSIVRECIVPVIRENKVVSILGIGNKPTNYTEKDAEIVSYFADLVWEIVCRKVAEEALRESEKRLNRAQAIAKMGDFIWDVDSGEVMWSDALFDLLGYNKSEKIDFAKVNIEIHHPDDLERIQKWLADAVDSGKNELPPNEYRIIRKDGEVIYVRTIGIIDRTPGKSTKVIATLQDITQRTVAQMALQENQRRLSTLMNNLSGMVYRCQNDAQWTMDFVSNGCEMLTGYKSGDLLYNAKKSYVELIYPEDLELVDKAVQKGVESHDSFQITYRILTADQKMKWVFEHGQAIYDVQGGVIALEGFITDITKLKNAEELIQKNLKEKEVLIRELYHRTKNNMQVISSMLRLQSRTINDKSTAFKFREIESKIQSMALVHKKLYESGDLSHLNLKEYIESLIGLLRQGLLTFSKEVTITFTGEDVNVLLDTAMPIGILINETVTNAIKYAFPHDEKGQITISMSTTPEKEIILEISDNGVGLPENFDFKKDGGIGLQTITDLVEYQLRGSVSCRNENGLHYRIVVKEELYKPRV